MEYEDYLIMVCRSILRNKVNYTFIDETPTEK